MTDIDIAILSVAFWYSIETTQHIVIVSSPHDSPIILLFTYQPSSQTTNFNPLGIATGIYIEFN